MFKQTIFVLGLDANVKAALAAAGKILRLPLSHGDFLPASPLQFSGGYEQEEVMGLDQFAMVYRAEQAREVQTDIKVETNFSFLHQWRKHPNLHGWMEALYREKGGDEAQFNCASVRIDSVDLDRLEAAIKANNLPETGGFFFGVSDPESRGDDLEFVSRARDAIRRGLVVFYDSWW